MEKYLGGEELTMEEIDRTHPQGHDCQHDGAGDLRYFLPEQGRAEAAGCHCRLYAGPDRYPRNQGVQTRRPARKKTVMLPTTSRSLRLRLRLRPTPLSASCAIFRVYSGTLNAGATVYNSVKDTNERIGRILQMHANHRQDIETVYAGDIAAAVGLKNTTTGDTLCDEKHPVILESMEFPEPVIRVAIEPKTKAGQEKMGIALAKLAEEDPDLQGLYR